MSDRLVDRSLIVATFLLLAQCSDSILLAQTPMVWTWSADQPDQTFIADSGASTQLLQTLEQRQDVDLRNINLRAAVQFLSDLYEVPIRIDESALEEESVSGDELITISLPSARLKNALSLILKPHNLTYSLQNESLLVTNQRSSSGIAVLYEVDAITVEAKPSGTNRRLTPFSLAHIIENSIAMDEWVNAGGNSTINPFLDAKGGRRLLVLASLNTQESIQSLLRSLAKGGATPPSRFNSRNGLGSVRTSRL